MAAWAYSEISGDNDSADGYGRPDCVPASIESSCVLILRPLLPSLRPRRRVFGSCVSGDGDGAGALMGIRPMNHGSGRSRGCDAVGGRTLEKRSRYLLVAGRLSPDAEVET